MYPVEISCPFCDVILRCKAKGAAAKLYLEGVVQTQSFLLDGSFHQPTAALGDIFFADTVFDKVCKAETWLTTKLKSTDQIDMTFMALDYFQLVPGTTGAKFLSEGLNRGSEDMAFQHSVSSFSHFRPGLFGGELRHSRNVNWSSFLSQH
jgi:hypothetical protein